MNKIEISFTLNGKKQNIEVSPFKTLLEVLREDFSLTGTKDGCGEGECGACTVIINGKAVNSCLVFIPQTEGSEILTIEGLQDGEKLHPIQEAFVEEGAVQCGFCIPGMVMSAKALLDKNPKPSNSEIRESISGNLCRCTGYAKIIKAIKSASGKMQQ